MPEIKGKLDGLAHTFFFFPPPRRSGRKPGEEAGGNDAVRDLPSPRRPRRWYRGEGKGQREILPFFPSSHGQGERRGEKEGGYSNRVSLSPPQSPSLAKMKVENLDLSWKRVSFPFLLARTAHPRRPANDRSTASRVPLSPFPFKTLPRYSLKPVEERLGRGEEGTGRDSPLPPFFLLP